MKTIIIPFNGSANCLDLIETIVSVSGNKNLHCIFLSISSIPNNYNDLFSLRTSPFASETASAVFYNFAASCKQQYGDSVKVTADHIYGDSPAVFRNYAQFKDAEMVVFDTAQWEFSDKRRRSGIFRMVSRCGCALLYVAANNSFIKSTRAGETKNNLWQKEMEVADQSGGKNEHAGRRAALPETVVYQYRAVNDMLNEWETYVAGSQIFSKQLGNMSRYFLKEVAIQKMLDQSQCSSVLLKRAF